MLKRYKDNVDTGIGFQAAACIMQVLNNQNSMMKFIKGVLFDDVKLQMEAKLYSELYNKNDPPKPIDIMQICIIRIQNFQEKGKEEYLQMEHFIEGEYKKFNSNSGYVSEDCRRTPQVRDKPNRTGLSTE